MKIADTTELVRLCCSPSLDCSLVTSSHKMGEEKQGEAERVEGVDLTQYKVKVDHFEGVHVLNDEDLLAGAPNFRQVGGEASLVVTS